MMRFNSIDPCYLIRDQTTNKTVAVVRGTALDAEVLGEDDPLSWCLTSDAAAERHKLVAIPCSKPYQTALDEFRKHYVWRKDLGTFVHRREENVINLSEMQKQRQAREEERVSLEGSTRIPVGKS